MRERKNQRFRRRMAVKKGHRHYGMAARQAEGRTSHGRSDDAATRREALISGKNRQIVKTDCSTVCKSLTANSKFQPEPNAKRYAKAIAARS